MARKTSRCAFIPCLEGLEGRALLSSVTPNDTYFPQQWGLNNTTSFGIDAPEA